MYDEDDAWSKQRPRCAYQIVQNFTNVCREVESSDKSVFFLYDSYRNNVGSVWTYWPLRKVIYYWKKGLEWLKSWVIWIICWFAFFSEEVLVLSFIILNFVDMSDWKFRIFHVKVCLSKEGKYRRYIGDQITCLIVDIAS